MKWGTVIFSFDSSGNVEYVSKHTQHNADRNSAGWYIKKITWSGSNATNIEELRGAHNRRAQLNWE
jgi:hypothetical protein